MRLHGWGRSHYGKGEDPRYTAAFRNRHARGLHWHTLTKVFLLQGALAWPISAPVQLARFKAQPGNRGRILDTGRVRAPRTPGPCCIRRS